jgi:hypothetical protein
MRSLLLAIVMTFSPFIVPAHATDVTGGALAFACLGNVPNVKRRKNEDDYVNFCNTYINAWDDAVFAFLQGPKPYCPPKRTIKELSIDFFDYMATHKEARDLPAAKALMLAFKDRWPCH